MATTTTATYQPKVWTPGDWNAFFGFGTNILVNMLVLTGLLRFVLKMPDQIVFGLPVVLYRAYLPAAVQAGAETAVGIVIVVLAVMLLARWRRGLFADDAHAHAHRKARTARGAYAIGLVHGAGGTAGVGVLLLASIKSSPLAIGALALFAACTAVSMALLSTGVGAALGAPAVRRSFARVAPVIGASSLAFGVWYALGAQGVVPYAF